METKRNRATVLEHMLGEAQVKYFSQGNEKIRVYITEDVDASQELYITSATNRILEGTYAGCSLHGYHGKKPVPTKNCHAVGTQVIPVESSRTTENASRKSALTSVVKKNVELTWKEFNFLRKAILRQINPD
ncbi:hypothetical protein KY338_05685 [Candidatus Woesearchaeota archaeon]|nr:hypothetical protein [Candidatus Woesearchaeota archaeon]MBW3006437.1 hypothetical protein [Candidatus Woesearchaeota archaeon]